MSSCNHQSLSETLEQFESAWQNEDRPEIAEFLPRVAPEVQSQLLLHLIRIEIDYRRLHQETPDAEDYAHLGPQAVEIAEHELADDLPSHLSASSDGLTTSISDEEPLTSAVTQISSDSKASGEESFSKFIGPYKLLQQIGEGGMGSVWMAEQQEPVRRLVALKLMRADMESDHRAF